MKTMTCRQLGGPCDLAHRGETHNDVIIAQDAHLKEAEKAMGARVVTACENLRSTGQTLGR